MAWWQPAGMLDQQQKEVIDGAVRDVENASEGVDIWVKGPAGTGKTIVLAHIAHNLKAKNPNREILFLTYTHALKTMIEQTVKEAGLRVSVKTYMKFLYGDVRRGGSKKWDVILLDEVQDVGKVDLAALRSVCTNLVVAGDCNQRIYEHGSTEPDIDRVIVFNKRPLKWLYRISASIVDVAQRIFPETFLSRDNVRKVGDVTVAIRQFERFDEEVKWVYEEALSMAQPGYPSVILIPRHRAICDFCKVLVGFLGVANSGPRVDFVEDPYGGDRFRDYDQVNAHFSFNKVPVVYLGSRKGDLSLSDEKPIVYLMTYHSAKGLDFENVFMPMLSSAQEIGPRDGSLDQALFYVAMTRARSRLVFTFAGGSAHRLVSAIPDFSGRLVKHSEAMDEGLGDLF